MDKQGIINLESFFDQLGNNKDFRIDCHFGKNNKVLHNINPPQLFYIYNLYKSRSKTFTYERHDIGETTKIYTFGDPKNYVKDLFNTSNNGEKTSDKTEKKPDLEKIEKTLFDKVAAYKKLSESHVCIANTRVRRPVTSHYLSVELTEKAVGIITKPKYQKHRFVCILKGLWDIHLSYTILINWATKRSGVFFEMEARLDNKSMKKTTKDSSISSLVSSANPSAIAPDQLSREFLELYNAFYINITCAKSSVADIEMRYGAYNSVITLERGDLERLKCAPYSLTEKADGERVFIDGEGAG